MSCTSSAHEYKTHRPVLCSTVINLSFIPFSQQKQQCQRNKIIITKSLGINFELHFGNKQHNLYLELFSSYSICSITTRSEKLYYAPEGYLFIIYTYFVTVLYIMCYSKCLYCNRSFICSCACSFMQP